MIECTIIALALVQNAAGRSASGERCRSTATFHDGRWLERELLCIGRDISRVGQPDLHGIRRQWQALGGLRTDVPTLDSRRGAARQAVGP